MSLRILMLEDSKEDAELIERVLKKANISFESTRVDKRDEFIDKLKTFKPTLVLSDHSLPQFNSIEALKICREMNLALPFILVTGAVSDEFAVNCLKMGADDYLLKSNLSRLPASIVNALHQRQLQAMRKTDEVHMRQQNKALAKLNEEMDNFMYSVSHNLRQPLASVMGLINLVRNGHLSEPDREEMMVMMEQSVRRLDRTLHDILDYSRNGRLSVTVESLSMTKLIEQGLESLRYLPGYDDIEKIIEVDDVSGFSGDGYRLPIILSNVLSNSIRYQDDEKQRHFVTIRATITQEEAIIFIVDNGIGIDSNSLPKVFEMFFRGTQKSDGAGIGLYIAKEMIEKLKGTISIESRKGEHTVVVIHIPNGIGSNQQV